MAAGQVLWLCRGFGFLWLCCVLTLIEFRRQGDFCEFSDESIFPGLILDRSCHQFAPRCESSLRCLHLTKWQTRLHATTRVKRSTFATALYSNSTLTFRPVIQLIHDIETNPGPDSYRTSGVKKKTNGSDVKIAHLNVCSLKSRHHYVLVKETILTNKFDIFTISESWLDDSVMDREVEIPGYDIYRVDRQNKDGGGICVYVLQSFKTEFYKDLSYISASGFHQLWLKIQIRNLKSIVICTTYRPPNTPLSCFDTDLTSNLISMSSLNFPIYILGDLNCNLLNGDSRDARALVDFYRSYNLSQLIDAPTRITESSKSLLDVILASHVNQVQKAEVIQSSISDHDLVCALLRLKKLRPKPTFVTTRSYKHYNPDAFLHDISQVPWSVIEAFSDVDDKLNAFNLLFNDIFDQHAPLKTFRVRGKPNPCVTDNIRALMRERDSWRRLAKRTNDPMAWSAYKNFRREVKREIKLAEREFVTDQIQSNPRNSNNIWKAIRHCIPKNSTSSRTFSRDDKTVADEFNNFFVSVGQNTVNKIKSLANEHCHDLHEHRFTPRQHPTCEQFSFSCTDSKEIKGIIASMPSNKASGIDNIPIRIIKDCIAPILPAITSIVNSSLGSSTFPSSWKIAQVVPIPKDGDHEEANNNRPISLLPVLSKICERVAHNQFNSYLTSKERLSKNQSGNKKWHSTETTVIKSTDAILSGFDESKLTAMVLLDMSKAFDSISHEILLLKLKDVGASNTCLQWFHSYLSDRQQVVRINSTLSESLPLRSGVPQGSILGPLLFSIYVNDLPAVPQKCISHSYVDDTKLQVSFKLQNKDIAVAEMNEDLCKVCNWCFRNYLLLNPDKSKLMVFGTRKMLPKLQDITLSLLGKDLLPSKTAKDLGVLLDPHLSYNNHIIKTVSSCMSSLGQINRVKHAFDRRTLLIVMNTLVFSKLFYCSNVWANCSKLNIDKLQSVQNFACRIVSGIRKYDHVTPELKRLKWLPVSSQLYYRNAILAFKCMYGHAPEYLSTIFTKRSDVNRYTTRSSQLLNIPLFKTASGQRTFYYRTVSIWNSLESNLKLCSNETIFKKRLKSKLLADFLGCN